MLGVDEIRAEVARLTGIPKEHLGKVEDKETTTKHAEVREFLERTVFGQQPAIDRVVDSITVSMAGLKDPLNLLLVTCLQDQLVLVKQNLLNV